MVGSYTYTDAEYTTDTNYKGNTPAAGAKTYGILWGITPSMMVRFRADVGYGVRYTGSSYGDPQTPLKVEATRWSCVAVRYDLARVGMAGSNVALHVNNLFDREYVASCFNTYGCFWGAERQVVATRNLPFLISLWARFACRFKLAAMQENRSHPDTTFAFA